ncbi:MAG: hypothetical protein JW755_14210 [Candidatus Aminicenantes bacterium]|nr:hypothetical protein [Candidatus Aminicenantes bacterium]
MRRFLLLDADVVIDLHTLGLFGKIEKAYDVCLTRTVFEEARFYRKGGVKIKIGIKNAEIIEDLDFEILKKVQREAGEARLGIDPGESTSIAYLIQTETDITFCTCDQAAIKLIAYMDLERKAISLEKALLSIGYRGKNLYPRHFEKTFKLAIREGKSLRIQFKKWV